LSTARVRAAPLLAARCPKLGAYRQWRRPPVPATARYPAALAPADAPASLRPQWQPPRSGQRPRPGLPHSPGHHPAAKVGFQAAVAEAYESAARRHALPRPLRQAAVLPEAEHPRAELSLAWTSRAVGSAAEWLLSVASVPAVRVERPSRSPPARSSSQTPVERGATAWVVEAQAGPIRVSRPRFPGAMLARPDRLDYPKSWDEAGWGSPRWPLEWPF